MKVLRLDIENFRCIRQLHWEPRDGRNVLIGPANCGKSTILEGLRLLLGPDQGHRSQETFTRYDLHGLKREPGYTVRIGAVLDPTKDEWLVFPELEEPAAPTTRAWEACTEGYTLDDLDRAPVLRVAVFYRWDAEDPDDRAVWFFPKFSPPPHPDCRRVAYAQRQAFGFWCAPYDDPLWEVATLSTRSQLARTMRAGGWDALHAEGIPAVMDELLALVEEKAATLPRWQALRNVVQAVEKQVQDLLPSGTDEAQMGVTAALTEAWLQRIMEVGLRTDSCGYIPMSHQGAGAKRVFAIAARAACSELTASAGHKARSILAVDEPEVGLHAQAQRALLASIADNETQSFIATHSSAIVDASQPDQVWRLKASGGPLQSIPSDTPSGDNEKVRKSAERYWSRCCHSLFGRAALIVEGSVEEGALPVFDAWARTHLADYAGIDAMGVSIVSADSISGIASVARTVREYGVTVVALHDCDTNSAWPSIEATCDYVCRWPDDDQARDFERIMACGTTWRALLRLFRAHCESHDASEGSLGRLIWGRLPKELKGSHTRPPERPVDDLRLAAHLAGALRNSATADVVREWLISVHGSNGMWAKTTRNARLWAEACVAGKSVPAGVISLLSRLQVLANSGFASPTNDSVRVCTLQSTAGEDGS